MRAIYFPSKTLCDNNATFELKGKGARAGRTGYGQIVYSAGAHLKKVLLGHFGHAETL